MGRTWRVGLVAAVGCAMLALPATATDYKLKTPEGMNANIGGYVVDLDNDTAGPIGVSGATEATTVTCDTASKTLVGSRAGFEENPETNPQRSEFDPARLSPACEEMRDIVLLEIYERTASPPALSDCHMVNGRLNCYAFQTAECDLYLMLYGNLVRICVGGIWPYN